MRVLGDVLPLASGPYTYRMYVLTSSCASAFPRFAEAEAEETRAGVKDTWLNAASRESGRGKQ